ncbi:MAG: TetR/AcrR family transcriptional regulator C-terminal domain-containing protein [Micrococcales bacterium]|nr:TetR/AcrR family transcriptional regulator C-terminal domain-containing protein [Micrococcales bacterium]
MVGGERRPALSRDTIVEAAVRLADAEGIERLSMRRLGRELGVEAMSLYHHLHDKAVLLDAMVDCLFAQIEVPQAPGWRDGLHRRAVCQRQLLQRHPWALGVIESRTSPGITTVVHHDAVLGYLRTAGFSVRAAGHVFSLVDAYVYGFCLQEHQLPLDEATAPTVAHSLLEQHTEANLPHLQEYIREVVLVGGYDYAHEFEVGLGVVLDAATSLLD